MRHIEIKKNVVPPLRCARLMLALLLPALCGSCGGDEWADGQADVRDVPIVAHRSTVEGTLAEDGATRGVIAGNDAFISSMQFVRADDKASDKNFSGGFSGQTGAFYLGTGTRQVDGLVVFDSQVYDKSTDQAYAYLRAFAGESSTQTKTGFYWIVTGDNDLMSTQIWNAGNIVKRNVTDALVFGHELAWVRVKLRAAAGYDLGLLRAQWGEVTSVTLPNQPGRMEYAYATNQLIPSGSGVITCLNSEVTDVYEPQPIPAADAATIEAAALIVPGGKALTIQLQTSKDGLGGTTPTTHTVTALFSEAIAKGKQYTATCTFDVSRGLVVVTQTAIEAWKAGTITSPSVMKPVVVHYGGRNGKVTTFLKGSTTDSYNGWGGEVTGSNGWGGGNGIYWTGTGTWTDVFDEKPYARLLVATKDAGTVNWSDGSTLTAKDLCRKYVEGDAGWRLPRLSELHLLYLNRAQIEPCPGFTALTNADYWSGTESAATTAWMYNFGGGGTIAISKNTAYRVRCVKEIP